MKNVSSDVRFYHCLPADPAADDTDADGAVVDMAGFDGCLFVTAITDSVATGVASLNVKQSATSGGSYAALSGATATATCAVNDDLNNKLLVVDVYRPSHRYLKANIVSSVANIAFGETYAFLYGAGRVRPVTQLDEEVADLTYAASPA